MITKFKIFEAFGDKIYYHGTNTQNIINFRPRDDIRSDGGIYFTDSLDHASDYGENIYKANLDMNNPLILDAENQYFDDYYEIIDKNVRYAKNSDEYDSVIIKNLKDPREGKPIDDIDYDSNNIYVVFSNKQIQII